jgi:hypothetical protein
LKNNSQSHFKKKEEVEERGGKTSMVIKVEYFILVAIEQLWCHCGDQPFPFSIAKPLKF